jgi:hypothetical protein
VKKLARLIEGTFRKHGIFPRVAVYAPYDLPYGLSKVYSVESESFESVEVFRNLAEAKAWLLNEVDKDV